MTRVLMVCLGNICRSPTAEGVLRALAAREFPQVALEVDSAGTANYHVGQPPDRRSVAAARRRGYEISGLRARQVRAADLQEFDFVLAMDRANLAELQGVSVPGARAHIGLLLEFADDRRVDEVPDPYYGSREDFEHVVDLCEAAARGLLRMLAAGPPSRN
jgi:protein-tyrosine phosphatase